MDFRLIFMGVLFSVIWSSAFTSARILMSSAPPFLVLSLRFLISGILGIAIARLLGQNFNLSRQEWIGVFIFGFCQNVLNLGLNFVAMQWIDASMAVIIASMLLLLLLLSHGFIWWRNPILLVFSDLLQVCLECY